MRTPSARGRGNVSETSWGNVSETISKSDASETAIQSLLVECKQRALDREMHQDPDREDIPPTMKAL